MTAAAAAYYAAMFLREKGHIIDDVTDNDPQFKRDGKWSLWDDSLGYFWHLTHQQVIDMAKEAGWNG